MFRACRVPIIPRHRWAARSFATATTPQTVIEKIVQKYAVGLSEGSKVRAGDYVMIKPEHVMTHDNTGPVISKFLSLKCSKLDNPRQPVYTLDHDVQNKSDVNQNKYKKIEAFAKEHGVDFYPAGRGIGHQIVVEEGYAWPGKMVVASDSHSNHYGGVGCLGTAIVRTDAAGIWATGKFWWQIPRIVQVSLDGKLSPGVTGKDVIVALAGLFNKDEVLNAAIEFTGSGVEHLSIDERLTIANMTTEWGAVSGVFPVDGKLEEWYKSNIRKAELRKFIQPTVPSALESEGHPRLNSARLADAIANRAVADEGAQYAARLSLDLSTLVPHVSGPNSVKVATALPKLLDPPIPIHKAYLVSCTNSRASDLAAAAAVLRGKKVAPGVEFYIAAASSRVQEDAEEAGDWQVLVDAGAKTLPAGCGPCIGLGVGLLEKGQVGISATNRNYKGRMGSPEAIAYLASPAVVAASAARGVICGPDSMDLAKLPQYEQPKFSILESGEESAEEKPVVVDEASLEPLLEGFPAYFEGPLMFAPQDNLTTDGMYPGKYTYQDDITPERQAEVVMENYDPAFAATAATLRATLPPPIASSSTKAGPILLSGYNFGTGSSREQAATAIKNAGIPLVICGSFGDIYKRNAINNGLILVESPSLIKELTERFAKDGVRGKGTKNGELTEVPEGWTVKVDSRRGLVTVTMGSEGEKTYPAAKVGKSVQELWVNGGLEGFIKASL
ncbi:homoaconitase, mitochondrial [Cryptococcus amylolentus CBS 6039]|uniref:Homoaconitase, mitochondrial n=2 Tax=Cryptococcus amylolentus TaxID=104669 RepID=A0A1E3HIK7_9TREE|nr:homoaconitase, mitochondrial [Cryptococcus amylolentus CBS 6039]ODN76173.1 homoaconitase, mitochondrial [Cryptococcus amylolentus CBS 6039]ODN96340.1 homoaconitase, mitochondrial [Cryptococcus amylolentus CBS 6273]